MRNLFLTVALIAASSAFADPPAVRADEIIIRIGSDQMPGLGTMIYDSVDAVGKAFLYTFAEDGHRILSGSFKVKLTVSQAGALLYLEEKNDDWILHLHNVRGHRLSDVLGEYYGVRLGGGIFFNARLQTLMNKNMIVGVSGHQPQAGDFLVGPSTGVMWVSLSKCEKDNQNWDSVIQGGIQNAEFGIQNSVFF